MAIDRGISTAGSRPVPNSIPTALAKNRERSACKLLRRRKPLQPLRAGDRLTSPGTRREGRHAGEREGRRDSRPLRFL